MEDQFGGLVCCYCGGRDGVMRRPEYASSGGDLAAKVDSWPTPAAAR
jgi:hypothetical protein